MASRDLSAGEEVAYVPPVCMLRNEGYLKLAAELRQQMQLAAEVPDMAFFAAYVATLPVRVPPGLGLRAIGGGTSVVVPASLRTGFNLGFYHGSPGV